MKQPLESGLLFYSLYLQKQSESNLALKFLYLCCFTKQSLDSSCVRCSLLQGLFEMAISRYIDQPEKKDLLLQLLQWMPDKGYFVDSSTRNLLLKNSKLFGAQQIAETLSRQHISSKAPRSHEMKDNLS